MSRTARFARFSARTFAKARPGPRAAPVMTAVLFLTENNLPVSPHSSPPRHLWLVEVTRSLHDYSFIPAKLFTRSTSHNGTSSIPNPYHRPEQSHPEASMTFNWQSTCLGLPRRLKRQAARRRGAEGSA